MQECGSLLSAEIVVDLLVIVVSQALIARAVAITAIDYIDRTLQNSLECPSIISHNATNMTGTASNRVVEHERIKHQAFGISAEQTSLNIRSRDRRKFCVIDEPRQYENLRLSQEREQTSKTKQPKIMQPVPQD